MQFLQTEILSGSASHDLSMWGLFLQADLLVKLVMLLLVLASFWCWAIIFEKTFRLRRLNRLAVRFEEVFWSGASLDELYDRIGGHPGDPMSAVFVAAMREWRRSTSATLPEAEVRSTLAGRIDRVMGITVGRELDHLERYMNVLASVGATAPFLGLFGTVWGIMNSFRAIAVTKDTSLAVVAPGIAEALFATALGLIAAIPAVVAYNKLINDIARYAARLDAFAGEFAAVLSRIADTRS